VIGTNHILPTKKAGRCTGDQVLDVGRDEPLPGTRPPTLRPGRPTTA